MPISVRAGAQLDAGRLAVSAQASYAMSRLLSGNSSLRSGTRP